MAEGPTAKPDAADETVVDASVPGFKPVAKDLPPICLRETPEAAEDTRPVLPATNDARKQFAFSAWTFRRTAFVLIAAGLALYFTLLVNHIRTAPANPYLSQHLHDLKKELHTTGLELDRSATPEARASVQTRVDELVHEIRILDHELRRTFFTFLERKEIGTWVIFAVIILILASARMSRVFDPDEPHPTIDSKKGDELVREARLGRGAVYGMIGLLVVLAGVTLIESPANAVGHAYETELADQRAAEAEAAARPATRAELAVNWPMFRGPFEGQSLIAAEYPSSWDVASGAGVLWKTQLRMPGLSAPVVWDRQVFITGANKGKREIYCLNADTGRLAWSYDVKSPSAREAPDVYEEYMYAAATPATDGRRVYAIFPTGDLVVTDTRGQLVWSHDFGLPENPWGHSQSPVLYDDLVIVPWDHEGASSGIYAFRAASGGQVWKIDRSDYAMGSWSTPLIVYGSERDLLITAIDPDLAAFDVKTGAALWTLEGLGGDVGPSPVVSGDIVYAVNGDSGGIAARFTDSSVERIWYDEETMPSSIPSPSARGDLLWMTGEDGSLTCYSITDGTVHYTQEMDLEVWAAPVLMDDRLLVISGEGKCVFVGLGTTFEELGTASLETGTLTSPAFHRGRIYMRDGKNLVCLAAGKGTG